MLLHAFPSMSVSSLREFPENCVYRHGNRQTSGKSAYDEGTESAEVATSADTADSTVY
jgi:hypothetical protein